MQLTHSPSTRIPSTAPRASSYRRPLVALPPIYPADVSPYLPTYRPLARTLASKQPRVTPTLSSSTLSSSHPPPPARSPRPIRSSPRGSLSTTRDSKLSILSGATFTTPTHPSSFSSLRRPIHRVSTRSTLSYRSPSERAHIFPTPRPPTSFPLGETTTDRPRGFLQDEERERGEGGREGWPYILLSFFERFQAHRSSTTARPVLVTRRCDAPTRSLSPCSFFPE